MDKLQHLVESQQLSREHLESFFDSAEKMRSSPRKFASRLSGKVMAVLFYEPSTRTRLSFESAMSKLGGHFPGTENAREFSSAAKGETLEDTIEVVRGYADTIVMRHNEEGASQLASQISNIPIINAGDGKGQHPTQAALDVYTIKREFGEIDNKYIAMVGDLKNGRTVRSLAYLSSKFKDIRLCFVSPPSLRIGNDIKAHLLEHKVPFTETDDLNSVLKEADVIYMTRTQKERMTEQEYIKSKEKPLIINENNLPLIKTNSRIFHPLPKIDEIALPFKTQETDPRCAFFRQAHNGLYIRMAILDHLLYEG